MNNTLVVNLRGTNGSGKSTLVRRMLREYRHTKFMGQCLTRRARRRKKGEQVLGYRIPFADQFAADWPGLEHPLCVVGPYEPDRAQGCDTVPTQDEIHARALKMSERGHVLWESYIHSDLFTTPDEFARENFQEGRAVFAFMDTPEEECIRRVYDRRRQVVNAKRRTRGLPPHPPGWEDPTYDPKNLLSIYKHANNARQKLGERDHPTYLIDHTADPVYEPLLRLMSAHYQKLKQPA